MAGILSSVAVGPTVAAESGQGTFGYEEMKQGLFTPVSYTHLTLPTNSRV